jgi:hypothetical protein
VTILQFVRVFGHYARLVDELEVAATGDEFLQELVDVGLAGPDCAERDDLGTSLLRSVGHGDGILVNVETDKELWCRLRHG